MKTSQRLTQGGVWLGVVLLGILIWGNPGQAQSQAPDTSIDSLVSESVVLFMADMPLSGNREIIQIHGKVGAASEHGVWLKPTFRFFKGRKDGEAYEGPLFVPWSSIGYVKVKRK